MKITVFVALCLASLSLAAVPGRAQTTPTTSEATGAGPEMLRNGGFEAGTAGWSLVTEGGGAQGDIRADDNPPPSPNHPHALRLTVTSKGRRCGIANAGERGLNIGADTWYDAVFFARSENNFKTGLVFSLESGNGKTICTRTTLPEIGGDWQTYNVSLHTRKADPKARLVISPIDPGVLWLGAMSLRQRGADGGTAK